MRSSRKIRYRVVLDGMVLTDTYLQNAEIDRLRNEGYVITLCETKR